MVITLIGLSGCGKSHLAKRIEEEQGFRRICCDDLIEERLSDTLAKDGCSGIEGVAHWMGHPYEERSKARQDIYLSLERNIMQQIISELGEDGWGLSENIVIDSTGSLIYTGEDILEGLKRRSRLIYLGVPDSEIDFMFEQFQQEPKPLIWDSIFSQQQGESEEDALKRCYPLLLQSRAKLYSQFADVALIMDRVHRDKFSSKKLLSLLGAR